MADAGIRIAARCWQRQSIVVQCRCIMKRTATRIRWVDHRVAVISCAVIGCSLFALHLVSDVVVTAAGAGARSLFDILCACRAHNAAQYSSDCWMSSRGVRRRLHQLRPGKSSVAALTTRATAPAQHTACWRRMDHDSCSQGSTIEPTYRIDCARLSPRSQLAVMRSARGACCRHSLIASRDSHALH